MYYILLSAEDTDYDFTFPLPEGSRVYGDKVYNIYETEDELKDGEIRH